MNNLRVGVIGLAQMHIISMVDGFLKRPDNYTFMGIADLPPLVKSVGTQPSTRPGNRAMILEKLAPISTIRDNYLDLLDEEPDLVLVASENATHGEICCQALSRGIHVILEKPMTITIGEARAMAAAEKAGGAKLLVNWPTSWYPGFRTAQRLVADGAVGTPFKLHYRNPESLGPFSYGQSLSIEEMRSEWWYQRTPGGGAFMDYVGYGANISRWFLGKAPESAFAVSMNVMSHFGEVEDQAAVIVRYPSAIALLEATWATRCSGNVATGPIVYGDAGTLVSGPGRGTIELYTERHQKTPTRTYDPEPLPEGRTELAAEFLHWMDTGELHPTLDTQINVDAMSAVDAAYRSLQTQRLEPVLEP